MVFPGVNEWSFLGLVCLINFLCLRDYFSLMQKMYPDDHWPSIVPVIFHLIGFLFVAAAGGILFQHNENANGYRRVAPVVRACGFLLPAVPVLLILVGVLSKKVFIQPIFQSITGLFYITLPMTMLLSIKANGTYLPLVLIVMIWSNDTMAYLVGSFFGKTPFSPISPKKTWEGTAGGAIITMIAAGLVGYFTHTLRIVDWVMLALCATVAGTLGDLLESKLKRMANVKDSGTLMPGHGGALDRFDSLLVAAPFAFAYVVFLMS